MIVMIFIFVNKYYPIIGSSLIPRAIQDSPDDIVRFRAKNKKNDKFIYDGTYYVLQLGDIKLSTSNTNDIVPFTVITNGYCNFDNGDNYDYNFGKEVIRAVYHSKNIIYLLVPVSYIHNWITKKLVSVRDNHYFLEYNMNINGGITRNVDNIFNPFTNNNEIPPVVIN
jgi:hypothetical protein